MAVHIVEFESFTQAELETLEFFPEELKSIEAELYPNLESISPEKVAKDLEAYFEGDDEAAGLEGKGKGGGSKGGGSKGGSSKGGDIKGGHSTTKKGKHNKDDHQKADAAREKQQYDAYVRKTRGKNGKNTKKVLNMQDWRKQGRPSVT